MTDPQTLQLTPLVAPVFVAGLLTFLAPCTLPLLPGFLAFLAGGAAVGQKNVRLERKFFVNVCLYVLGFSLIFIAFGVLAGFGGLWLLRSRTLLAELGGTLVAVLGLYMLLVSSGFVSLPGLARDRRVRLGWLKPGEPLSSFLLGVTFAFGWSPCVGPVLGAALTLAAGRGTAGDGAVLLAVFSLGLAVPFVLVSLAAGWVLERIRHLGALLRWLNVVGGLVLLAVGLTVASGKFDAWVGWFIARVDLTEHLLNYF